MTITQDDLQRLREHWAVRALGSDVVSNASTAAQEALVRNTIGQYLVASGPGTEAERRLISRVAVAYEVAASESLPQLLSSAGRQGGEVSALIAESAAHEAFSLRRSLPLDQTRLDTYIQQILMLGSLAYCSDRWAEFRSWLRDHGITPESLPAHNGQWDQQLLGVLGETWIRLLRKQGWDDLARIPELILGLRELQQQREEEFFARTIDSYEAKTDAWRLVALYHWAKATEVLALYSMQGTTGNVFTEMDFHFERAIEAAIDAGDPSFEVVLTWVQILSRKMASGSLWAAARFGTEARRYIESALRDRGIFEFLPPQRVALLEQGFLDPAAAAVVVDLPTSAGKTTLAEFKIIQALNQFDQEDGWVAYVAPTRALVSQITRRLRTNLGILNLRVEQLSAAVDIDEIEADLVGSDQNSFDILVATPEKLHLLIRSGRLTRPLALIVLDEAHNIEDQDRGVRIELLLATIKLDCPEANFLLLMPFVPNANDLARWLSPSSGKSISLSTSSWQPNDRVIGLVKPIAPAGGRGRDWRLEFKPLVTSSHTLTFPSSLGIGDGPAFDETFSSIKNNLGMLATGAAKVLSERGTSIVVVSTIDSAWNMARKVADSIDGPGERDDDIELVKRFLATEYSPQFELISFLGKRIGVHHGALSDDARTLIEWLTESGKLRLLVSTTTVVQGLNFPVSSIFLASRHLPGARQSREMSSRTFWNLAGRAGRINQESVGVVGIACPPGREAELTQFVQDKTGDLISRLVTMLADMDSAGELLDLDRLIYRDEWADFRSYIAHLCSQYRSLEEVTSHTEQLLRNTFGYSALTEASQEKRRQGRVLLQATRKYAADLSERMETATLADSTGFSPEAVGKAISSLRGLDSELSSESWKPDRLFSGDEFSPLPELMGVLTRIPQLKESIESLMGSGHGLGERAAEIAADWVNGLSLQQIALKYFSSDDDPNITKSLTSACRAVYRDLANAGTWGITALSKMPTSGIDYSSLSEAELRRINLIGAMMYHGVSSEGGVIMRMSSVPRSAAESLGSMYMESLEAATHASPSGARAFLTGLPISDWRRSLPVGQMSASDMRRVWRLLAGMDT